MLVEPHLAPATVNALLTTGGKPPANGGKPPVAVDVIYADAPTRERRAPMLRAVFGDGLDAVAPDDGGDAIAAAFFGGADAPGAAADGGADGGGAAGGGGWRRAALEEPDALGRTLWCAELTVDMSKFTKQPEQVRRRRDCFGGVWHLGCDDAVSAACCHIDKPPRGHDHRPLRDLCFQTNSPAL